MGVCRCRPPLGWVRLGASRPPPVRGACAAPRPPPARCGQPGMAPRQSCCLGLRDHGLDAGRDDHHGGHRVCPRGRAWSRLLGSCRCACLARQL
eukprot:11272141-Alexandrium_andersonii.AAC.1